MTDDARVLILTDRFPPWDRGGAERIAYYNATALRDHGIPVSVFTSFEPGGKARRGDEDGIDVHRAFSIHPTSRDDPPSALDKALSFPGTIQNPAIGRRLSSAIHETKPALVHAHYVVRISYGAFVRSAVGLPKVLTFHGYQYECPKGGLYRKRGSICADKPWPCRIFQSQMTRQLGSVDRILAISHFIRDRLISSGHRPDQVQYLPNGVPGLEARESPPIAGREVLFVGRLVPNKGVGELISAFRQIEDSGARLSIVGDGTYRSTLESVAAGDPRITFEGWLSPDEVAIRYRRCRLVAVPSLWHEVMNTVICEAQSWSRPVVATHVGGNGDLIADGESGYLCEPGNIPGLRDRMGQLLRDEDLAERMGQAGRSHVSRFSMERHVDDLISVYSELAVSLRNIRES